MIVLGRLGKYLQSQLSLSLESVEMWRHSSPDLSLLLLPLSPRTAVMQWSAKPTSWKVNTWVNLVVVFPPTISQASSLMIFGQNCLICWELWRRKTAQTKPVKGVPARFFPIWAEENNFIPLKPMGRWISCWKTVQCWIITPVALNSHCLTQVSQPWHHLVQKMLCGWFCLCIHCRMFSSTPDLYPPDASGPAPSHPPLWQPKVSSRHH